MTPLIRKPYKSGELWIGRASFDESLTAVKYAYPGKDQRISRGSPEVTIEVLADMAIFAAHNNQFNNSQKRGLLDSLGA